MERDVLMRLEPPAATLRGMDRVIVVAPLTRGAGKAAEAVIAAGPPFALAATGVTTHSVFLSGGEVVFLFEGLDLDLALNDLANDPVVAASFSRWAPLLAGTPRLAHETYRWSAGADGEEDQSIAAPSSSSPRSSA